MLRTSFRRALFGIICCLLAIGPALTFGQTGTTSIRGNVLDNTNKAIVGAVVTLANSQTGLVRTTASGATGEYEFIALTPGTYTLKVQKDNFQSYEQANLQLLVNLPATQNVILQVGSALQTVEVSAQLEALNTTDASLGNAFNENQVKQLPLEGRNVAELLSLQPGVAYPNSRTDIPSYDTRKGAVNGARSDESNVTVDGVPTNDIGGAAFTSVLPVTLDSVQEFRVSTSNYNADEGTASGAQVALVTKSGTDNFHGSLYEYNRNTSTSANDYFVKGAQIDNCVANDIPLNEKQCNQSPKLIRNIFGASLGGPIKKDRLFFFINYEGTRRSEAVSQTATVPSQALRDGVVQYQCQDPTACPGGTVTGVSGKPYTIAPGTYGLSAAQLKGIDPLGIGANTPVLQYLQTYPVANTSAVGDGLNYQGYNWSAPISDDNNVYIAKLDYNITQDGKHHVSIMGAMENDNNALQPYLPGQLPTSDLLNYSKGIILNYNGVISSTLINSFRYGFVRQSVGNLGNSDQQWIYFRGLNDSTGAITRSYSFQRPINTFADDVSWIHGKHTLQFGAQLSFIRTTSESTSTSFSDGITNASWIDTSGYAGKTGSPLNPTNYCPGGTCLPAVDPNFANSYDYPMTTVLGLVSEADARYNFNRAGDALPQGAPINRRYAINGYEFYLQDTWKLKPTFTLTLGLRYNLYSPPWETNKLQVQPTNNMDTWFLNRAYEGANGIPSNQDPPVSFDWSGKANNAPGYYNWDPKNLGPRLAFAWAPQQTDGLLGAVLGRGLTSIRGGFSMIYDRFGQGIADDFSQYGSFGLSSSLSNPAGFQTVASSPRVTNVNAIPTTDNNGNVIFLPPPPADFPVTYPTGTFSIGTTIDQNLKTPYSYTMDFSVSRQLKGGFVLEAAYVGRLGRRLLTQLDSATALNFKDKGAGIDYFTAVTALAKLYRTAQQGGKGVTDATFSNAMLPANVVKYWQDVVSPLATGDQYALGSSGGCGAGPGTTTNPVLAAFDIFCGSNLNETTGLLDLDYFGIPSANGAADTNCGNPGHLPCAYLPSTGQFTFYNPQFATAYMWKSMGTSNYNALQVSLQHKMAHGVQFDFNYTYSKSLDVASDAERVGTISGLGSQVINAWSPNQFYGPSDFDATHQFTANWVVELPFGTGKAIGGGANAVENAFIGGWQLSGLFRLTTGFPFSVFNGAQWPTDWDLPGNAYLTQPVKTGAYKDPNDPTIVNAFSTGSNAQSSFVEPLPGQAGTRNNLRGQGFFGIDLGISKRWTMPWSEKQSLQFRMEVFNITNSVRFDAQSINASIDSSGSNFGNYSRLSTNPRVAQFALRYEF
ncbi:MAG: carboxypeptidase-like regulatory domain-containing protein [Candidatus Acidiferrum sp.]